MQTFYSFSQEGNLMSSCGKLKNEIGLLNVQERAREEQICRAFFSGGSSWGEGTRSDTDQTEQAVGGGGESFT